jgi:formylglycine-generating enzyme required for sulfatase activity
MSAVNCPACRQPLPGVSFDAGRQVPCLVCGHVLTVPEPKPAELDMPTGSLPPTEPHAAADNLPLDFLRRAESSDELGRLGGYRILSILGCGGMGVVFKAENVIFRRFVALKAMRPGQGDRRRFLREARAAAALKHDRITPISDYGEDNNVPFFVMPLLAGEPLSKRLKRDNRLPIRDAIRIGREIAEGLAVAHAVGIVHRDIKPANVWLEEPGAHVKLLDFGLSRTVGDESLTQVGEVCGTPSYTAPEQIDPDTERQPDHRADLFSLGCVLYEMTTGQKAFAGDTLKKIYAGVLMKTPPTPLTVAANVPGSLSDFIMQLLAKNPNERPATAEAVARKLSVLPGASGVEAASSQPVSEHPLVEVGSPRYPQVALADAPRSGPREGGVTANSLGMKFAFVPRGSFWMGGGGGQPGDRQVTIERDFRLGIFPVTQGQWRAVTGDNRSYFSHNGYGKDKVTNLSDAELQDFPVEQVSWYDVQEFLRKLNEREKNSGFVCRLPTEAEWEYACRGGALSSGDGMSPEECSFDYYFAQPINSFSSLQANFDGNFPYGGADVGPYLKRTSKVGSYEPNRLGLYDLHGNVWEWCEDLFEGGPDRVLRGGCWYHRGARCRAAVRYRSEPSRRISYLGFRLAQVPTTL